MPSTLPLFSRLAATRPTLQVVEGGFSWEVSKRYSEFVRLHEAIVGDARVPAEELPALPPKFYANHSEDLATRMLDLDAYLRALLLLRRVRSSEVRWRRSVRRGVR